MFTHKNTLNGLFGLVDANRGTRTEGLMVKSPRHMQAVSCITKSSSIAFGARTSTSSTMVPTGSSSWAMVKHSWKWIPMRTCRSICTNSVFV